MLVLAYQRMCYMCMILSAYVQVRYILEMRKLSLTTEQSTITRFKQWVAESTIFIESHPSKFRQASLTAACVASNQHCSFDKYLELFSLTCLT